MTELGDSIATLYVVSEEDANRVENNFIYHPPTGNQSLRYETIRESAKNLARLLMAITPKSREQSLALTKLEEAVFWANASIARNEQENK